jgi:hypothetical protein
MGKPPAFQFYPGDWFREPGLRASSIGAKGAWAQILFSMHDAKERGKLSGSLEYWGNLIGVRPWGEWEQHGSHSCSPWTIGSDSSEGTALALIRELVEKEVCEIEFRDDESEHVFNDNGIDPGNAVTARNFFVTIINRRMHREFQELERNRIKQQNYRDRKSYQQNTPINNDTVTEQRYQKVTGYSSSSSSSSKNKTLSDDDFLRSLKEKFTWIDFDTEMIKIDAWLLSHTDRKKTRRFITNWMLKKEKPIGTGNNKSW